MGGDAHCTPAGAADVWKAAADAWTWAASIHGHAAQREHKRAWTARSEVGDTLLEAAEAGRQMADAQGTTDAAAAAAAAAAAMRRASASLGREAAALERSSRLNGSAAAWEERAAASFSMARDVERIMPAIDRAAKSRMRAGDEARTAMESKRGAEALARDAGILEDGASRRAASGSGRDGDRGAITLAHADMREDARRERVRSAEMLCRAEESTRLAARAQGLAEAAARRSAEASAGGRGSPDAQEAAAAWREAMEAANAADEEYGGRRMAAGAAEEAAPAAAESASTAAGNRTA